MRILFVHNDYGKFSGEEAAVEQLAQLLVDYGHQVSWLRRSSAEIAGSRYGKVKAFWTGVYNPHSAVAISKLLDQQSPEVVHVQNIYPLISPSILRVCRDRSVPVVMRCPNYRLFCPTGLHLRAGKVCEECLGAGREWNCVRHNCADSFGKSMGYAARNAFARKSRMILDNVSRFIVLSKFQKQKFVAGGIPSDKIDVLPNIAPVTSGERSVPPVSGTVAFVGRLSEEKGIREFLDAARALPHIRFAAAGAISPEFRDVVESAPVNVRFSGFLSGPALDEFYEASRIVVCPSKWFEGFPNVIARAMAHGRPVIASRIGAISEIVDHDRTGLLCEPGDAGDLARVIEQLVADHDLCCKMGESGMRKAATVYSEARVYADLLRVYERALCSDR